jgi:hypothetical protein
MTVKEISRLIKHGGYKTLCVYGDWRIFNFDIYDVAINEASKMYGRIRQCKDMRRGWFVVIMTDVLVEPAKPPLGPC